MVQNAVQAYINDLLIFVDIMEIVMAGEPTFIGDQTTRQWTYNITDFALEGVSYQSDDWIIN